MCEAGVIGVLPGIIGSLQALEALKLVLGIGEPLRGRLLVFGALDLSFREFTLKANPETRSPGRTATVSMWSIWRACACRPSAA